ncbi:hypothetical protein [Candidatus Electronema sp. JM]|uniref:hypothetical protein n=1 Tax=Candidatus Electronema sp. JM TaxID=3401571 RepID=UPI003AA88100
MLLPREKPFLSGLNSYYLDIEKFIQHLQGEIGTGCLYGKGADQELMVYFDEADIVRGLTQNKGEHALASEQLDHVFAALTQRSFQVSVYYLDADSIFFWGQLPTFRRAKSQLSSSKVSLPDLVFRLCQKKFSGFIEVDVRGRSNCAVLFFHQGERRGGSYYWGTGGFSALDDDYNTLLGMIQKSGGTYGLGYFTNDPAAAPALPPALSAEQEEPPALAAVPARQLEAIDQAVSEFIALYQETAASKSGFEPLLELKLKFIDFVSIYPVLDPYGKACILHADGSVSFADDIAAKAGAEGLVDCVWMVIEEQKLHKKFKAALKNMAAKDLLRSNGIEVER